MRSLKFSHRIALILMLVLFVAAGVLLSAVYLVHLSGRQTKLLYDHPLAVSNAVRDINIHINAIHRNMKDVALAETPEQIHDAVARVERSDKAIHQSFGIVSERFLGSKEKILEVYSAYNRWQPIRAEVIELKLSGSDIEATRITKGRGAEHVDMLFQKTKELTDFAQSKADLFYGATQRNARKSLLLFGGGIGLLIAVSSVGIYFLSRSITHPISEFMVAIGTFLERKGPMDLKYADMPEEQILQAALLELEGAYFQLKDYNEELDSRVRERTRELTERESELRKSNKEFRELNTRFKAQNTDLEVAMKKAEESDRLKSAFLANMSHEIRTPMNAILGFSELLELGDTDQETRSEYIRLIRLAGDQLLRLISDIVDLSKIDAGQLSIVPAPCNLERLIRSVHSQFELYVHEGGPQLLLCIEDSVDVLALLDEQRLIQVLSNLLENAFKYTEEGEVELGCRVSDDQIHFRVRDTGLGISEENQKQIFERFRQLASPDGKVREGTGLGLSICQGLVNLMGGALSLESTLGEGSEFYVSIPLLIAAEEVQPEKVKLLDSPEPERNKVLIAEDEAYNRFFLESALTRQGFETICVENGLRAVQKIEEGLRPVVVLMDLKMPVMDGHQALKQIKSLDFEIPVIAQTAYAMSDDQSAALRAGFDDYIAKPISVTTLLDKMKRLIQMRGQA